MTEPTVPAGRWADPLIAATRQAFDGRLTPPLGDHLCLKNGSRRFAIARTADIERGVIALYDRSTKERISFEDVDALLEAGWVID